MAQDSVTLHFTVMSTAWLICSGKRITSFCFNCQLGSSRITQEGSLDKRLSRLGWPMHMSLRNYHNQSIQYGDTIAWSGHARLRKSGAVILSSDVHTSVHSPFPEEWMWVWPALPSSGDCDFSATLYWNCEPNMTFPLFFSRIFSSKTIERENRTAFIVGIFLND